MVKVPGPGFLGWVLLLEKNGGAMRSSTWGHIQVRCIKLRLRVTSRRELVLTGENRVFCCGIFTGETGAIAYLPQTGHQ